MGTPKIKATYAIDVETLRTLEDLARRWNVSKSEALRRAVRAAAREGDSPDALAALDDLQAALGMTAEKAEHWADEVRAERGATTKRGDGRGRGRGQDRRC